MKRYNNVQAITELDGKILTVTVLDYDRDKYCNILLPDGTYRYVKKYSLTNLPQGFNFYLLPYDYKQGITSKEIAEDHSVLLSTHILSEVQATCNDIRMIEHGKVVFSGSMKDFDNYVVPSSFTVTFALPPSIEELAKIEHVLNIEELYPGTFRIRFDDDENITERVVALSIQNGWRLKEITMERCSLDIIFAQLSGKLKNNI